MTGRQKRGAADTVGLLRAAVEAHPDREAYVDGDVRLTFAEWDRAADGVAALLHDRGVRKGDVVCLLLPSSADYAVAYQAAMRLGAITSGINPRLGPREQASITARTEPRVTVVDDALAPPPGAGNVVRRRDLAAARTAEAPPLPALDVDDPVAIVWTSGTTGLPKGAVFDHGCLRAMADGAGILSAPGDRRLSPLPFAHVGYMTRQWDEIWHGITTVITPTPWTAGGALATIERERVTVGQGVPAQWSMMLAHPDFERTDLSSLRLIGTGAATVPAELVRELRRRTGCAVVVRYASTEASLITGTRVDDPPEVVAETVGRPSTGVEVVVVDDDGNPVPPGEVGTVRVRSRAMMRGYWRDPERTAEAIGADGWLITGDLGRFDEAGNLRLVGRRAEMLIRGGYNVYPAEVENVLAEHPAIERVAVVGAPDEVMGERIVAFVVPRAGEGAPGLDEVRAWVKARLASYKAPDRVEVVAELPLTSMLKVDKRALAALAAQRGKT